jgi:hypothetical protein
MAQYIEEDRGCRNLATGDLCVVIWVGRYDSSSNRVTCYREDVTPGFKGQSRVHLIYASEKTTHIITQCIEINVTISSEYLLHSESLTK